MVFLADLLQTVIGIYLYILIVRFLMQLMRADFYNPLAQSIVKLTQPLVAPVQKVVPSTGKFSLPTLVVYAFVQLGVIFLMTALLAKVLPSVLGLFVLVLAYFISHLLTVMMVAMFGIVILSWVAPNSHHPGALLLHQLTQPLSSLVNRFLPPLGGLDFSPVVILLSIVYAKKYAVTYLFNLAYMVG